ncbi:MAG: TIGR02099 family protein [Methylococcaceae bacterium]|nr:TIGR02099 family protein [Methylococcaceae bacterium]
MIHHITRATQHLIFWGLIVLALALTVIRYTLSVVDIYKEDLESIISKEIAAPIKIGHLGAGMRGFRPELVLKQVQVLATDKLQKSPLQVQEIRLSMDLLKSYGQQQILASSWITLVGTHATITRHRDGRIGVAGLPAGTSEPPVWILQTAQFEILQSQLTWHDEMPVSPSTTLKTEKDILLDDVNLVLKSDQDGQRHVLNMLITVPKDYGKTISVSMQLRGNFLTPQGLNGLIYVEAKQLQFAKLLNSRNLPLQLSVTDGQGTVRLWSYWQNSQLQAITGTTQLQQLLLQRPAQPSLAIKQLHNQFNWVNQNGQWQLRVDDLGVNANNLQLTNTQITLKGLSNPQYTFKSIGMQTPQLDLQQMTQLSGFFGVAMPFPTNALQGQLKQLSLMLTPETQQFSISSAFDKVSLAAYQDVPGISNLSGHIQGDQQHGTLAVALNNTALDLPRIFAKPLPINTLHTRFNWQQAADDWVIASPTISAVVPDLQADSRIQLKVNRQTHAVWMDLQATFKGNSDIKSFARYWPVGLMGKEAVTWLNQAFPKGQVNPRGVLFSGLLADFPFSKKQGVFELILDFKGTDLQYAADWEPVRAIDAEVRFYNDGIQIAAERASVHEAKLQQFDINIPSFQTSPDVTVQIKGNPDIAQVLGYLQKSPVKNSVERLWEVINPQGLAALDLTLQVPLAAASPLTLKGALQLQNVRLSVLPLSLPVNKVQGVIDFNAQGVVGGQLHAKTLGDDIQVAIHNNADRMQLDIQGHVDILDLQQQFSVPVWRYAEGDTDYKLGLTLPNSQRNASLSLNSDLAGIALKLPDVLAKSASESRPLNMQMNLGEQTLLPIKIQLGKQLSASALLNTKQKRLTAAEILIGAGELGAMPIKGGHLSINLAQCTLADWMDLAEFAGNDQEPSAPFFTTINLHAQQLLWHSQPLGKLDLHLQHEAQAWQIALDSPVLKGSLVKPTGSAQDKSTMLDLDYVNLSALGHLKASEPAKPEIQRLPLFNLTAKQVLWEGVNVGALSIDTTRITNGIAFKQVSLKNTQGELALTGSWIATAAAQQTTATGSFKMHKFGDFLAKLHISKDVKATDATVELAVNWQGAPQHFALEHLQGKVAIELINGRILSIEPGFGRLLGFLAFEQWGRRLRLDFSDMLAEGLTFNRIHGHFDLNKGNAVTDNLVVDAVPAEVKISGVAHLAERTLDYRAKVLPKSSAALPIAGTIVDRVLTYTLETVTGNSQAGFLLGSEYKILGAWQSPQVIRLRENDGLLQKTWYGLTDFSWLQNNSKQP